MVGVAAQLQWDRDGCDTWEPAERQDLDLGNWLQGGFALSSRITYGQACEAGEHSARTRQSTLSAHAFRHVRFGGQSAEGAAAVDQAGLLPSRWADKERVCKQHLQPGHMLTRPACVPGRGRAFRSCSCSLLISRGTAGSFSCGRSPAHRRVVFFFPFFAALLADAILRAGLAGLPLVYLSLLAAQG